MRKVLVKALYLNLMLSSVGLAQIPFISSINKSVGRPGEELTIQGINFGTNPNDVKVVFGGVYVTPDQITDQFIKVKIPPAATVEQLQVLNKVNGFSGVSQDPFLLSFGGDEPFNVAATGTQQDFDARDNLYDLATADFDGDGKLDVATASHNATITVHWNTSSPSAINFGASPIELTPGFKTIHLTTGDLNGDGRPEIIVSELNAARVTIFRNTSSVGSISFIGSTITLTGSKTKQLKVADLDLDGRQELIVTDQVASQFFIFPNIGSGTMINLGTPIKIEPKPGSAIGTDALAIHDLNGDRFPEIIVGSFQSVVDDLFVINNNCSPGSVVAENFSQRSIVPLPSSISNLRIGDLNSDGKPDIAATLLLSQGIVVLGNQSTESEISFSSGIFFETSPQPWGLDFGDLDGDGRIDIAVASITQKEITILNNTSTSGGFSFNRSTRTTTFINRHVRLSDLNNDGRPDMVFTSINDGQTGIVASKVSVIKNNNCIIPKITPEDDLVICSTFSQPLEATNSEGAMYEWFSNGVSMGAPSSSPSIDVSQNGPFTVRMISDGGTCVKISEPVGVTVITEAPLGTATPNPVSPVCVGGTLSLSVNDVGADSYLWIGPDGFADTGASVSRTNFQPVHAGEYTLEVKVGDCIAQRETIIVDAVAIPNVEIIFPGLDIVCTGESKTLSFYPSPDGYDFQWMEETSGSINGATGSSHVVNVSGKYFLRLTSTVNQTCPPIDTDIKKIRVVDHAVADFTYPDPGCADQEITFQNTSDTDIDPEDTFVLYEWTIDGDPFSNDTNPGHTFSSAQDYLIGLKVSYRDGTCPGETQHTLSIVEAPATTLVSSKGIFTICQGDSLTLSLANNFETYLWSTGSTETSIVVKEAGTYTVSLTANQCQIGNSQVIGEFSEPNVIAEAQPESVNLGEMVTLSATGLTTYRWRPNEGVTDSLNAIATAFPQTTTVYIVSGIDVNGCTGSDTVEVVVIPEDNILGLLEPQKYFSPNGDAINDQWQIEGIEAFNCTVTIYNERGLKVYEAEGYDNLWDGFSSGGQKLPEGIYFYVIRCKESGDDALTGTLNIVR